MSQQQQQQQNTGTTVDLYSSITTLTQYIHNYLLQNDDKTNTKLLTLSQTQTALNITNDLISQLYNLQYHIRQCSIDMQDNLNISNNVDTTTTQQQQQYTLQMPSTILSSDETKQQDIDSKSIIDPTTTNQDTSTSTSSLDDIVTIYHPHGVSVQCSKSRLSSMQLGKEYGYRLRNVIRQNKQAMVNVSNYDLLGKLTQLYNSYKEYQDLPIENAYKLNKLVYRAITSENIMYDAVTHRTRALSEQEIQQRSSNKKMKLEHDNKQYDNDTDDDNSINNNNNINNSNTIATTTIQQPSVNDIVNAAVNTNIVNSDNANDNDNNNTNQSIPRLPPLQHKQ